MTAPPPYRGGFFVGHTMSEGTEQAVTEAADSERSEDLKDATAQAVETGADEGNPEKPEGDADDPDGSDDDKGEDDRPRKKSRSERLRRQNERLQAENAQLRSGSAPAVHDEAGLAQAVAAKVGEPPKEADYADWFEYDRALGAYEADKRAVTRQVKEQAQQAQQAQTARVQELLDDYQERCEETVKSIPDFYDVVRNPAFQTSDLVKRLILDSGEKAPLVAYHLAKNPRLAASINGMSPIEAAREMGRIEGRVSAPKPKTATTAAAPLSAPRGSAAPSSDEARMNSWLKKHYG